MTKLGYLGAGASLLFFEEEWGKRKLLSRCTLFSGGKKRCLWRHCLNEKVNKARIQFFVGAFAFIGLFTGRWVVLLPVNLLLYSSARLLCGRWAVLLQVP